MRKSLGWIFALLLIIVMIAGGGVWLSTLKPQSNVARLAEIARARKLRDWEQVELLSRQWCLDEPTSADAWLEAAEAAEVQGAIDREAAYLEQLPDDDKRTPAALMLLANIYFNDLNRPLDGVKTCERALKIDPKLREAHRRLIFFHAMTLQHAKLTKQVNIAISLGCDSPETYVYLVGSHWLIFSNSVELNRKWLRSAPENELFEVGALVNEMGSPLVGPDRANELEKLMYEKLVKYPKNIELLAALLSRKTIAGDSEAVIDLLSRIPAEAKNDSRVWYYVGWLQEVQGDLEEAEKSFRKSLELDPYDYVPRLALVSTLRRKNKTAEAEENTALAVEGKELRSLILGLSDVASLSRSELERLARYVRACGGDRVADQLELRLAQFDAAAL